MYSIIILFSLTLNSVRECVVMLDAIIVGKVLQRFREQKKQSQELVSGFAGIGRTHLSAIERGERKPTLETFFKICEALNVRPSVVMAAIEEEVYKHRTYM